MMEDTRYLKIMFNKSGGTASKNSYSPKISIPKNWLDEMKISLDDRDVKVTFDGTKITIEKSK